MSQYEINICPEIRQYWEQQGYHIISQIYDYDNGQEILWFAEGLAQIALTFPDGETIYLLEDKAYTEETMIKIINLGVFL